MIKNVLIPLSIIKQIVETVECLMPSDHSDIQYNCEDIILSLKEKIQRVELRDAYSKIIFAKNDDERDIARIEYMTQRRNLPIIEG